MKNEGRLYGLQKGILFKKYWDFSERKWVSPGIDGLDCNCYTTRPNVIYWYDATLRREYPHKFEKVDIDKLKEEEAELRLKDKIDEMID